jgi:hypothetical protein
MRGFIHIKPINEVEEIYKVGTKFDSQISSFSLDRVIAEKFAGRGVPGGSNTSVVLNLESGAKGLNVSPVSGYFSELERIFHGRFEVVKVERSATGITPAGQGEFLEVHIRQINNFVKEAR